MRGLVLASSLLVARAAIVADLVTTLPGYGECEEGWRGGKMNWLRLIPPAKGKRLLRLFWGRYGNHSARAKERPR
jgi:hypothetical protein